MKNSLLLLVAVLLWALPASFCKAQDYQVRIGFIGNSITAGTGLANPARDSYPSQFAQLMTAAFGDTCVVGNFGVSGRTMLKNGDFPIWKEASFTKARQFAPDIVFIVLGTNDTKPYNWDDHKGEFIGDYLSMIDTFKVRNPNTRFIICYPPPAFAVAYDIRDSVILNGVIPAIDEILKKREAYLLDFYHPLLGSVSLFPDKIHPNPEGAAKMAKLVYDKFIETDIVHQVKPGYTFITDGYSNTASLAAKDTAILNWNVVNADSVYLDGQKVDLRGGVKVAPEATKTYLIKAFGPLSNDSLTFTQNVYLPVLNKMNITPTNMRVNQGDSIELKLTRFDQNGKLVKNYLFPMKWTIERGLGTIVSQTNTSAVFIAGSSSGGKVYIKAESGGVSVQANFIINTSTSADVLPAEKPFEFSPNPFDNQISFSLNLGESGSVTISLYDSAGRKVKEKVFGDCVRGLQKFSLNTEELRVGMYLYRITGAGAAFSGKIEKRDRW